jgi:renalase
VGSRDAIAARGAVMTNRPIAIVGAGIAGLAAARYLADAGRTVVVFDKGRGAGGRIASRIVAGQSFDYGAPFVTREGAIVRHLDAACRDGHAGVWHPRVGTWPERPAGELFVGTPDMRALTAHLARGLEIRQQMTVTALQRQPGGWQIGLASGDSPTPTVYDGGLFSAVIVTAPAPQAVDLLQPTAPGLATALAGIAYAPCLTLMLAYERPFDLGFEVAANVSPTLALVIARPGRPDALAGRLVAHASVAWSHRHVDRDADDIARLMLAEVHATMPMLSSRQPAAIRAHRWRLARTTTSLRAPFLFDRDLGLGFAGDGCLGPTVADAFDSGTRLAEAVATP